MPAFCAAFGSFHPKSSVTYFVTVLTTVCVLPFFLTFTLIRSSTLTVSIFGVRSYSDQRYWSMQTSGSRHESRGSELEAGREGFCTGSVGLTAANSRGVGGGADKAALPFPVEPTVSFASFRTGSGVLDNAICCGGVDGRGIAARSDKAALPLCVSATKTLSSPCAVAWGALTCSARAVADVARSIGAPLLSVAGGPKRASAGATQQEGTAVPQNAADAAIRRGFFTPLPLKLLGQAMADSKFSR